MNSTRINQRDWLVEQLVAIAFYADVAVQVAELRGERVPEAVLTIRHAGREAIDELRRWSGGTIRRTTGRIGRRGRPSRR